MNRAIITQHCAFLSTALRGLAFIFTRVFSTLLVLHLLYEKLLAKRKAESGATHQSYEFVVDTTAISSWKAFKAWLARSALLCASFVCVVWGRPGVLARRQWRISKTPVHKEGNSATVPDRV